MIGGHLHRNPAAPDALDKADLRAAYDRGRNDERAARKRHPLLMTLTVIAAIIGVALLALAAIQGSFGRAGGVVDQQLSTAADQAGPAVRQAVDNAGQRVHDATRSATSDNRG
jgi:hypothetical protein